MNRLILLLAAILPVNLQAAQVTNVIDAFTAFQSLSAENYSATNTTNAPGAIGGFRTISLSSLGNELGEPTLLVVTTNGNRLILTTPEGPTPNFQITWGGAGGIAGIGNYDFGGGQTLDLSTSMLSFNLRSADLPNDFRWEFTDSLANTAAYTGNFPSHLSTNAPLPYNITLNSFANASSVNWNAIDFIVFSGGNVSDLDMSMSAPIQLVAAVPEPRTYALLIAGLCAAALAVRRRTRRLS